jgi:hypothetical protein
MVREVTPRSDTRLSDDQVRPVTDDDVGLKTLYQLGQEDVDTATMVEYERTSQETNHC